MMDGDTKLTRLVRSIYSTPDVEIDCTACLDQVATYVDKELAGADAAREMPDLAQHLALCGDCFEEYEALRDLAALDAADGLPDRAVLLHTLEQTRRQP